MYNPSGTIHEVIAVPIFSTDTGDLVSALVVGFKPFELGRQTHRNAKRHLGGWPTTFAGASDLRAEFPEREDNKCG